MSSLGVFEHHFQLSVGDSIPFLVELGPGHWSTFADQTRGNRIKSTSEILVEVHEEVPTSAQLSTMFFFHLIRLTFVGKKDPNILRNRTLLPQKAKIADFVTVKHLMIWFLFYHIPPHILPYVSHMFPLFSHLSPQMLRWSESRAPRFIRATAQPSRLKWFALGLGYLGPFGLVTMRNSVRTWYNQKKCIESRVKSI